MNLILAMMREMLFLTCTVMPEIKSENLIWPCYLHRISLFDVCSWVLSILL